MINMHERKGNREDMCKIRKGAAKSLRRVVYHEQLEAMEASVTSQAAWKGFTKH